MTLLHITIRHAGLAQEIGFSPTLFPQFAEAGEKAQQSSEPAREKSVINMIWLLLPVFDWPSRWFTRKLVVDPTYLQKK